MGPQRWVLQVQVNALNVGINNNSLLSPFTFGEDSPKSRLAVQLSLQQAGLAEQVNLITAQGAKCSFDVFNLCSVRIKAGVVECRPLHQTKSYRQESKSELDVLNETLVNENLNFIGMSRINLIASLPSRDSTEKWIHLNPRKL